MALKVIVPITPITVINQRGTVLNCENSSLTGTSLGGRRERSSTVHSHILRNKHDVTHRRPERACAIATSKQCAYPPAPSALSAMPEKPIDQTQNLIRIQFCLVYKCHLFLCIATSALESEIQHSVRACSPLSVHLINLCSVVFECIKYSWQIPRLAPPTLRVRPVCCVLPSDASHSVTFTAHRAFFVARSVAT